MRIFAWLRAHWQAALVVLGAGLLALAAYCHTTPTPIPPKEQTTLDSLRGTKPDFQRRIDTLVQHETTYVAISRQNRSSATIAARRADSLRAAAMRADSVARAARDTSSLWERAADVWHATADTLASANLRLSTAYAAESTARRAADARADEFSRRLTATTDLNTRLAADLRRADAPCRVVWVLRCPSRTVAYAVGVLTIPALRVAGNLAQGKPTFSGVLR